MILFIITVVVLGFGLQIPTKKVLIMKVTNVDSSIANAQDFQATRIAIDLLNSKELNKLSKSSKHIKQHKTVDSLQGSTKIGIKVGTKAPISTPKAIDITKDNDINRIVRSLYLLVSQENNNLCSQIELLLRFDELEGWRTSGSKSCAAWMNSNLNIDHRTAWERLRVGRKLKELPLIKAGFQDGRLSWSKVRLLTRVANSENEKMLVSVSVDATVSDVQRVCEEYRWNEESPDDDCRLAEAQLARRSFRWRKQPDGCIQIILVLPPDKAQNYLHAIEHCEEIIYEDEKKSIEQSEYSSDSSAVVENTVAEKSIYSDVSAAQRRADAAVLLAERSIAHRGANLIPADRYQVVLNVDSNSLYSSVTHSANDTGAEYPDRKPYIEGIGSVPVATARLISCDCSIINILTDNSEPLSVGRKQRIWPAAMRRSILHRDRHCQFPGCSSHRFLHIHHIKHWADGGETSTDNAVCLCHFHHHLVHNEQYSVERTKITQTNGETTGLFPRSKMKLLPTRCRFVFRKFKQTAELLNGNSNRGVDKNR